LNRREKSELVAAFAAREVLARRAYDAGVSEQEWEAFWAGTLFGNKAAAEIFGRSANQIGQEKHRAEKKLRPPA
jgi:hypothetical protein